MNSNTPQKVIQIGNVPPPFGGVSIHLQRLVHHLKERKIPHQLLDISGVNKTIDNVTCLRWRKAIFRLLFTPKAILHFHNFTPMNLIIYSFLGIKHHTILTFHNERFIDELQAVNTFIRSLLIRALNRLDKIIVDSEKCYQLLCPLIEDVQKVTVIPEYITPVTVKNPRLPQEIISLRHRYKYLIASNAFEISFYKGFDLYGIDLLIDLVDYLVHEQKLDVGLVFLLPSIGDKGYFNNLKARIAKLSISESFLFITKPVADANAVWQISDLVIRATNTDGNSLTVKEALFNHTPVIASDCVPRDPQVILFKTRDLDDLKAKTVMVLSDINKFKSDLRNLQVADSVEMLIDIYDQFMRSRQ